MPRLRRALGALLLAAGVAAVHPTGAGAIVTHRASSCNSMEVGGTLTVTKPAGVVADDVLIATAVQNDGGNISAPAGWTVLQADQSDAASWYRVAGGSEPASYNFSKTGGDTFGVIISAFAGGDTAAPIAGSAKATGTTASQTLPNTTALRNGSMRWSSGGLSPSNNATATYGGGMTKSCERAGNDASISAAYEATNAGTTASRTVTWSAADPHWLYTAVVNAALPEITSLSPSAGPPAGGQTVTITGKHFTSASGVTFGGTAGTSVTVVNDTTITVVSPAHALGTVDVRVTTPPGTSLDAGTADDYSYVAPPTITALSPDAGPTAGGNTVTITGTNFSNLSGGAAAVRFGATNATSYALVNATTITAVAPAGTGTQNVQVTTLGGTTANTAADDYDYYALPTVTALSPTAGPTAGGNTVTITGTNFGGLSGASAVQFGTTNATSYIVVNATTITAVAPAQAAGVQSVRVTTPGGTSANTASDDYTYASAPTVTSLSPTSGPTTGGTTVTITGTNFTSASAVTFGGTNATSFTVVNATTITATAPARAAGTDDVLVTTPGGTSANTASDNYTYVAAPTVTSLSPSAGPIAGGTSVTITGTNFTGATSVTFGGTNATSFTVVNATTITATAPARAAGTYDVLVTTVGGTSANTASDNYTYVAAPTVTSLSPTSGPTAGGTTVTITGTNFTGATAVTFGGTNATSFTVVNATTITATAPARAAGTDDVLVTTPGGTSANTASDNYTYVAAPTVTSLSPSTGPTAGGTTVTITGTNLTGATAVTFGGTNATSYTVVNATTITATAPARPSGTYDVLVTTAGGQSANTAADDYLYSSPPTVTNISPTSGTMLGGTTVTITGTFFTGATAVTFGGTAAAGYTVVNATTITATTPAHSPGTVDVRVTTPDGTSPNTAADDFTFVNLCDSGGLTASHNDFSFGSVAHNGFDRTLTTSTTVTVSDLTGTGAGWKLSMGATQFDAGGGRVLPTNAARIMSSTATPQGGSCVAPTAAFSAYPVTLPISPSTAKVYSSAVGTGTGPVDVALTTELAIPANARTGTYASTWTVDLAAAP